MSLGVTLDVFSGRPNPTVELDDGESEALLARVRPARRLEEGEGELPPAPTLGYRGVVFEQLADHLDPEFPRKFRLVGGDIYGLGLAHRVRDEEVEQFICDSQGPFRRLNLESEFFNRLREEVVRLHGIRRALPWPPWFPWSPEWPKHWPCPPWRLCRCAPLYEPGWWNVPARQPVNNCYNYATNVRTDTFAQPGRAAGAEYASLACADVRAAAIADELIDQPQADDRCPPEGHLVALVVAPGWDFHWYRKGRNALWSHKPGGGLVTNVDNAGVAISDPRNADRGPYTDFCTFMVVMHGHVKIS